jgi:hypothetical protein
MSDQVLVMLRGQVADIMIGSVFLFIVVSRHRALWTTLVLRFFCSRLCMSLALDPTGESRSL